jgi:hypothetical protein
MPASSLITLARFLKEALWAQRKNSQENNMTGQNLVAGINPCPKGLGDGENHSAHEGSPEIPQPTNNGPLNLPRSHEKPRRGTILGLVCRRLAADWFSHYG